jgi:hypothetical protein
MFSHYSHSCFLGQWVEERKRWPLRELVDHVHAWGPWEDDVAGRVRFCACGKHEFRPEG